VRVDLQRAVQLGRLDLFLQSERRQIVRIPLTWPVDASSALLAIVTFCFVWPMVANGAQIFFKFWPTGIGSSGGSTLERARYFHAIVLSFLPALISLMLMAWISQSAVGQNPGPAPDSGIFSGGYCCGLDMGRSLRKSARSKPGLLAVGCVRAGGRRFPDFDVAARLVLYSDRAVPIYNG